VLLKKINHPLNQNILKKVFDIKVSQNSKCFYIVHEKNGVNWLEDIAQSWPLLQTIKKICLYHNTLLNHANLL